MTMQIAISTVEHVILRGDTIEVRSTDVPPKIRRISVPIGAGRNALYQQLCKAAVGGPRKSEPPWLAEFLLIAFATTRRAEYVIGCRNERFVRECKELGRDRAVRRYWADTLRSLWPLLGRMIGKALKWGAVIAAMRRFF